MSDYSELKSAAERIVEVQTSQDVPIGKLFDEFVALAEPEVILALIAESERLERKNANQSESIKQYQDQVSGGDLSLGMLIAERDQLQAENEELVDALNEILRVTPMGVEAFGIAALVLGELGVNKEAQS